MLREGGSVATVAAELGQEGTTPGSPPWRRTATWAGCRDDVGTTAEEPSLPPLEECVPASIAPEDVRRMAPLLDRFDMRFDPARGVGDGRPSGNGHIQAWFRMADGHDVDPRRLLMVFDALPPVTFDLGRPGWAPTLELTVHVRAAPRRAG